MSAYLIDHPPVRSQYRKPRRDVPSGVIVIHTAENTPDYVAFDGGAEAVARYIQSRTDPGSYHELVDSDSAILMVPYAYEAFHDGTGGNRHELSISVATRADVWPLAPQRWRDGAIENAAKAAARQARWVKALTGTTISAQRITAAEARAKVPGFVSHAQLDPTRRTDPGKHFPWATFLGRYAELTGAAPSPAPLPEADVYFLSKNDDPAVWFFEPGRYTHVPTEKDGKALAKAAGIAYEVGEVSPKFFDRLAKGRERSL